MNDLVFLEPNCIKAMPFTTSDVVAEYAKISHHAIQQMISKHEVSLKKFGIVAFEMRKLSGELLAPYETESIMKPAFKMRPLKQSVTGQSEKIYRLNEQQATILITFLKNTEPVINFKVELVRQFYLMRAELQKRQMLREQLKPIRRELTDVINEVDPGRWSYKKYTNLAYKSAIGKNAAQLRKDRGAPKKSKAIDFMTSQEIEKVTRKQSQISVLCDMGLNYEQVKELVLNHMLLGNIGASVAISSRWDDS